MVSNPSFDCDLLSFQFLLTCCYLLFKDHSLLTQEMFVILETSQQFVECSYNSNLDEHGHRHFMIFFLIQMVIFNFV